MSDPSAALPVPDRAEGGACPLVLLVHGRANGEIPAELKALATELRRSRGAPVLLRALTDPRPADLPPL